MNNSTPISSRVLQKHLNQNQHPIFQFIQTNFDKFVNLIKPFYSITIDRIIKNFTGLITSKWEFQLPQQEIQKNIQNQKQFIRMSHYLMTPADNAQPSSRQSISLKSSLRRSIASQSDMYKQKYNKSIFMLIWGPITTIILTHLISNHPFTDNNNQIIKRNINEIQLITNINVFAGGLIHLLSMVIISFVMFVVYKTVQNTQVHSLFQHLNLASYVGVLTILVSIICSTSINLLIIPFLVIYIVGCSYLHVNAYNKALKPQLLQLAITGVLIFFFYTCTGNILFIEGYMFYHYYSTPTVSIPIPTQKPKHQFNSFVDSNQPYLHHRNFHI